MPIVARLCLCLNGWTEMTYTVSSGTFSSIPYRMKIQTLSIQSSTHEMFNNDKSTWITTSFCSVAQHNTDHAEPNAVPVRHIKRPPSQKLIIGNQMGGAVITDYLS